MTKKNETQMVAGIIQHVTEARDQWFKEHDKDGTKKKVYEHLDKHEKEVFLKLLGFDKSWSNDPFKVDHCNGMNNKTIIGDYIKSNHLSAVHEWLDEQIGDVSEFKLTKATIKDIKQNIMRTYQYKLERRVGEMLEDRIQEEATRILDEVVKECVDPNSQEDTIKFAFELIESQTDT